MGSRFPGTSVVLVLLGVVPGGCGFLLGDSLDVTLAPDAGLVEGGRADDADTPPLDTGAEARDDATSAGNDASSTDAASDAGADSTPEAGGGGCDGGPCVLADDQPGATLVIVDDTNIYFNTQSATNDIFQCPKTGCRGSPLQLGTGMTTGLAVDAKYVYWGDYNGGTLQACTIGGCNMSPIVLSAAEPYIEAVISDGTTLFWTTQGRIRACTLPCDGGAGHAPRSVGNPVGSPPLINDLAADQGNVFWSPRGTTSIYGCDANSCANPTALTQGGGGDVFASHRVLYFAGAGNDVEACAEEGCAIYHQTIGSSSFPSNIVSDGVSVYWRDQASRDILKCPTSGCTGAAATYIARQSGDIGGRMALDGQNIYWCTTRQVLSFPK